MLILETAKYLGTNQSCINTGGVYISLTHYKREAQPNLPLHAHVNPHLTLLLEGGTAEKWKTGVHEHHAGDIVFYPAGEPHQNLQTVPGSKNINFEFEPAFFKKNGLHENVIERAVENIQATKFLLLRVYRELLSADPCAGRSADMLLLQLLQEPKGVTEGKAKNKPVPGWAKKVGEYLGDKWNEPVTLQQLSQAAGVHPITISKHFPRYFSCTLGEYLRRLKTDRALILVKSSTLSLAEIACECGFADQSHFIRVFRTITGFLPNDFRKL